MNDNELITNYLSLLKSNVEVYVHGTIESSNKSVRKVIHDGLDRTFDSQERTFNIMVSNSMYEVSNLDSNEIKKVYNKICKKDKN